MKYYFNPRNRDGFWKKGVYLVKVKGGVIGAYKYKSSAKRAVKNIITKKRAEAKRVGIDKYLKNPRISQVKQEIRI